MRPTRSLLRHFPSPGGTADPCVSIRACYSAERAFDRESWGDRGRRNWGSGVGSAGCWTGRFSAQNSTIVVSATKSPVCTKSYIGLSQMVIQDRLPELEALLNERP